MTQPRRADQNRNRNGGNGGRANNPAQQHWVPRGGQPVGGVPVGGVPVGGVVAQPGRAHAQPTRQPAQAPRQPAVQVLPPVNPVNPVNPQPVPQPNPQGGAVAVAPADVAPADAATAPRFGNETFGYEIKVNEDAERTQFVSLIEALRKEAGEKRRERVKKDVFDKPEVQLPKGSDASKLKGKERSTAAMVDYPKALATPSVVDQLAADTTPAAINFRKLYILGKPANGRVPVKSVAGDTHVADLLLGMQAFRETGAGAGGRKSFEKLKGEAGGAGAYVGDDANVPTRRYAYVETSRQQMMAALGKPTPDDQHPAMHGRYQRHRKAMGLDATPTQIDEQRDPELARLYGKSGAVSKDVMANVHQFLGSGLNQRGVSLTSTPKKEVISNDGDPFESDDGVRLKIDLSLVPPDVILLNHYAAGGVGTRLEKTKELRAGLLTKQKGGAKNRKAPRDYNYAQSVVKNRELLLTELRPEWIVEVTDRLGASPDANKAVAGPGAPLPVQPKVPVPVPVPVALPGQGGAGGLPGGQPGAQPLVQPGAQAVDNPAPTAEQRMDDLRSRLGHEWYELGRADGAKSADGVMNAPDPVKGDPFKLKNYDIGFKAGAEEKLGTESARDDINHFWAGFDKDDSKKVANPALVPSAWEVGNLARKNAKDNWQELQRTRPAWYVLSTLRSLGVNKKKFREKMHDSFWLAWAAAAKTVPAPPQPVIAPARVAVPPQNAPQGGGRPQVQGGGRPQVQGGGRPPQQSGGRAPQGGGRAPQGGGRAPQGSGRAPQGSGRKGGH